MGVKVRFARGAWWVVVHHRGQRRMRRMGAGDGARRAAEKVAERLRAKLVLGELDLASPREASAFPFAAFAAEWLRVEVQLPAERGIEGALAPSSVRQREESVRLYLAPFFGTHDVREIRVADVQRLHDHLVTTGRPRSPRSIEIVLGCLRRILVHARARELVASNAVADWKERRGRRRGAGLSPLDREKALGSAELEAMLTKARELFARDADFLLFLADTGCRLGEAIGLQWRDVDLARAEARIERSVDQLGRVGPTKTRRPRVVELSTRLRERLAASARPIGESSPVFPSDAGGYRDAANFRNRVFDRLARAVLGRARRASPHTLRHTWASRHLAAGTPIKWVQERGGWTTAKILLEVYGHFLPRETHGYADRIAAPDGAPAAPQHAAVSASRPSARSKIAPRKGKSWCRRADSNRGPADYESAALPTELRRPGKVGKTGAQQDRGASRRTPLRKDGEPGGGASSAGRPLAVAGARTPNGRFR